MESGEWKVTDYSFSTLNSQLNSMAWIYLIIGSLFDWPLQVCGQSKRGLMDRIYFMDNSVFD